MIIPKPLFTGARVALIAPSGPVPEGRLEPAVASVQALGLEPVVFPHRLDCYCKNAQGVLWVQ